MNARTFKLSGKKVGLTTLASLGSTALFAQDQAGDGQMFVIYALLTFVILVMILVIVITFFVVKVINILAERSAREHAEKTGIAYVPPPSWWQTIRQKLTRATPVEKEEDIILDHNYDGIRELDNHLPPWWTWLFYGTIAWAAIYLVVYHVGGWLPLSTEEYLAEVEEIQKLRTSQQVVQIDETALEFTADPEFINKGKEIFVSNCASCHRNDGGGGIGPNLTDAYWLHGGSVRDIFAVIKNGVPEKGMISWAAILKPEEIRDAAFFIMSIQGTNPVEAKAPQGEIYNANDAPGEVRADSVVAKASVNGQ